MGMNDVEFRHLSALVAVAEEHSFGRAATRLGYTQSAVSQQIAALEKAVGGRLFERPGGPRPVELTPLGGLLLEHAEGLLERMSEADRAIHSFGAGVIGTLSVGTFQSVSVRMLPTILRRFRNERPQVEVKLFETDEQSELEDRLKDGRLDVAFLVDPFDSDTLDVSWLCEDPFVALSPLDEPLYADDKLVDVAVLDNVPLISQYDTACQRLIDDGLRGAGIELNVVFRSGDNSAVQAMVRAGMGHAVMPSLAIDEDDPGVIIRRMDPGIPARTISIAKPLGRDLPPAMDAFIEIAVDSFRHMVQASTLVDA